jgi:hypothetical protein
LGEESSANLWSSSPSARDGRPLFGKAEFLTNKLAAPTSSPAANIKQGARALFVCSN